MNFFSCFTLPRKNCAKLAVFVATILLVMNLFASVDSITILNGTECEQTGVCQYRMHFSSWFSINPSYPEDYDYYRNIKDPQNNWHGTNGTLLDCMTDGVCTAIAADHVDFNYIHPDSGAVVVNMQVEDSWGGDYAAATFYHDVELFTVPDPVFQACITDAMNINGYTSINQITTLSCNSIALLSIEGVEMLPSLVSLNIAGSGVSDLSPVLQSNSLLSLTILDANASIYTITEEDLINFRKLMREHIACNRLYMPSCYNPTHAGDCPPPFFTDRCDNGTCHYDHDDNTSYCVPWYEDEVDEIKTISPFTDPGDSWNIFLIKDNNTGEAKNISVSILNESEVATVHTYEGKFTSWEYNNGERSFNQIHFYAAKPKDATGLPVLIYAHGAGWWADQETTNRLAAELNMFVIYYSGPGRGLSTGTDHTTAFFNNKMFDSSPDPRGSWFWADAVAGMRAITLAAENDDIDMNNIAMSGGSAGGIATLLASSVDDRIKAAVPFIASLSLEDTLLESIDPGDGYIDYAGDTSNLSGLSALLFCSDVKNNPYNWTQFIDQIAGKSGIITNNNVPTLFINGAVDSLFPLKAVNNTFNAMDNSSNRLSINYKGFHGGWIENDLKFLDSGTYYWLKYHVGQDYGAGLDNRITGIPDAPTVQISDDFITATVDETYEIKSVKFYYSDDGECTYHPYDNVDKYWQCKETHYEELKLIEDGAVYRELTPELTEEAFNYSFVVVEYDLKDPSNVIENYYNTFYISSQPLIQYENLDIAIPSSPPLKPADISCSSQTPSPPIMW